MIIQSINLTTEKDKGIAQQSAELKNNCLVVRQKFDCEKQQNAVVLDFETANVLREWLNINLPRDWKK